ncbi:hypothetical protein MUO65_05100, partial [bacterium]|nr:hypothetical protein [bacterium]
MDKNTSVFTVKRDFEGRPILTPFKKRIEKVVKKEEVEAPAKKPWWKRYAKRVKLQRTWRVRRAILAGLKEDGYMPEERIYRRFLKTVVKRVLGQHLPIHARHKENQKGLNMGYTLKRLEMQCLYAFRLLLSGDEQINCLLDEPYIDLLHELKEEGVTDTVMDHDEVIACTPLTVDGIWRVTEAEIDTYVDKAGGRNTEVWRFFIRLPKRIAGKGRQRDFCITCREIKRREEVRLPEGAPEGTRRLVGKEMDKLKKWLSQVKLYELPMRMFTKEELLQKGGKERKVPSGNIEEKLAHLPLYLWRPLKVKLEVARNEGKLAEEVYDRIVNQALGGSRTDKDGTIVIERDAIPYFVDVLNENRTRGSPKVGDQDVIDYLTHHERAHQIIKKTPKLKQEISNLLKKLKEPALYKGSSIKDFTQLKEYFVNNYGEEYRDEDKFVEDLVVVYFMEKLVLNQPVRLLPDKNKPKVRIPLPEKISEEIERTISSELTDKLAIARSVPTPILKWGQRPISGLALWGILAFTVTGIGAWAMYKKLGLRRSVLTEEERFRLSEALGLKAPRQALESLFEGVENAFEFGKKGTDGILDEIELQTAKQTPSQAASGTLKINERTGRYIRKQIEEIDYEGETLVDRKKALQEMIASKQAYVNKYVVFIKIPGLLENTGEFAHIGLGQTYGQSVVYIDE